MKKPEPGPAGTHAFYGMCAPTEVFAPTYQTFSVGCFEWVPASKRKTKRGPTKVRVTGWSNQPQVVYNCAADVCKQLDAGTYDGAKTINFAI